MGVFGGAVEGAGLLVDVPGEFPPALFTHGVGTFAKLGLEGADFVAHALQLLAGGLELGLELGDGYFAVGGADEGVLDVDDPHLGGRRLSVGQ